MKRSSLEKRVSRSIVALAIASASFTSAFADAVTVVGADQAYYDAEDYYHLATAEFCLIDDYLQIVVTESSTYIAGEAANFILADIYFNLPEGVLICSGNAKITEGSNQLNFSNPELIGPDGDISSEWGYTNNPTGDDLGPFEDAYGPLTAGVTTRPTDHTTPFLIESPTPDNPDSLAGPQAGMVSDDEDVLDAFGTSQGAVSNSITFQLWLCDGDENPVVLDNLEFLNNVVFEYGSDWLFTPGDDPEDPFDPVPEPGEYLMIMVGAFGLLFEYRRRKKAAKA